MTDQIIGELLGNGPLVMVLAWQLHLAQSRTLVLLERIIEGVEQNRAG